MSETSNSDYTPGRPLRAYDAEGNFKDFSTDEFVGRKLNYFRGWTCGAGVLNLEVRADGDIYAATCQAGGLLGNIYSDFTIPEKWLTCSMLTCSCGADLFIPKAKDPESVDLLAKSKGVLTLLKKRTSELSQLSALERTHSPKMKQVYWEIGRRCNYSCSYCAPYLHNKVDAYVSLEALVKATEKLNERFMKGSQVNFIISGGEPTINPSLMDWLHYLKGFGHHISIHSNGSRLPEYYRKLIHYADFNLSVHFEFWNPEKLLKVVEAVTEEKLENPHACHFEIKIMMAPGRREAALKLEQDLVRIPGFKDLCTWSMVPIRGGELLEEVVPEYTLEEAGLFGERLDAPLRERLPGSDPLLKLD